MRQLHHDFIQLDGFRVISLQLSALEQNQVACWTRRPTGPGVCGNGPALPNRQAIIVDPRSLACSRPGEIGEVWIVANGIADGY